MYQKAKLGHPPPPCRLAVTGEQLHSPRRQGQLSRGDDFPIFPVGRVPTWPQAGMLREQGAGFQPTLLLRLGSLLSEVKGPRLWSLLTGGTQTRLSRGCTPRMSALSPQCPACHPGRIINSALCAHKPLPNTEQTPLSPPAPHIHRKPQLLTGRVVAGQGEGGGKRAR